MKYLKSVLAWIIIPTIIMYVINSMMWGYKLGLDINGYTGSDMMMVLARSVGHLIFFYPVFIIIGAIVARNKIKQYEQERTT